MHYLYLTFALILFVAVMVWAHTEPHEERTREHA